MNIPPAITHAVIDLAAEIQQIPAPTFAEARRADFIQQRFLTENLLDVTQDASGNVFARLPGLAGAVPRLPGALPGGAIAGDALPVVVSAHLDTVFPAITDLTLRRTRERVYGPGIGDNSTGLAGLFGLLWSLRHFEITLPGDLWLVANTGEEGLGDLYGMRAVVDRFQRRVQAYIILEGMALGQVYNRALGVERYRIRVRTQGGHSWVDYGRPSAIHILADLVTRLSGLSLPAVPRTTLNVGVIQGGVSINTIAPQASLELDLRSESGATLARLVDQVISLLDGLRQPGVEFTFEQIGRRPTGSIAETHWLVQLALDSLRRQGLQPCLNIGSTDANIPLSRNLPAICVGLTNGGGAHTDGEYILTRPLAQGLGQLLALIADIYAAG